MSVSSSALDDPSPSASARRDRSTVLARLLEPVLGPIQDSVHEAIERDPFRRDPETVARIRNLLAPFETYYDPEVRGFERLPSKGPFLVVGNHSGGAGTVDLWAFFSRWVDERGPQAPLYSLTYDLMFAAPGLGKLLRAAGFIPASHDNAAIALGRGAAVVVFPGGDYEVFRPWTERHRIELGDRKGFVSLALRERVPVVPMTIHGTHESTFVLTRGRRIARLTGLDRLRVQVFPLIVNIPFGITPAFVPTLQLPSKIVVELGEPLDWGGIPARAADDPVAVQECYDEITGVMQATMDRLVEEVPWPILTRLGALRPDRLLRRWLAGGG